MPAYYIVAGAEGVGIRGAFDSVGVHHMGIAAVEVRRGILYYRSLAMVLGGETLGRALRRGVSRLEGCLERRDRSRLAWSDARDGRRACSCHCRRIHGAVLVPSGVR